MKIFKNFKKTLTVVMSFLMGFGVIAATPINVEAANVTTSGVSHSGNWSFAMKFDLKNGNEMLKVYSDRAFAGWKSNGEQYYCVEPGGLQVSGTHNLTEGTLVQAIQNTFNSNEEGAIKMPAGKSAISIAREIGYMTYLMENPNSNINAHLSGLNTQQREIFRQMYTWELLGGQMEDGQNMAIPDGSQINTDGTGEIFISGKNYSWRDVGYYVTKVVGWSASASYTLFNDIGEVVFGPVIESHYSTISAEDAVSRANQKIYSHTEANDPLAIVIEASLGSVMEKTEQEFVKTGVERNWYTTNTKVITSPNWYNNLSDAMDTEIARINNLDDGSVSPSYQKDLFNERFEYEVTPPAGMTMAQYMSNSKWTTSRPSNPNYDSNGDGVNDMYIWYSTSGTVYVDATAASKDGRFTISLPLMEDVLNGVENVHNITAFIDPGSGLWSGQNISKATPLKERVFLTFDIELIKYGHIGLTKTTDHRDHTTAAGSVYGAFATRAEAIAATASSSNLGTGTVGADGRAEIRDIIAVNNDGTPRTVYVKELSTGVPYLLNSTVYAVTLEPSVTVELNNGSSVENSVARGQIELSKLDSETNKNPQGEATLQGAVYEIELISSEHFPSDVGYKETLTIGPGPEFKALSSDRLPLGTYRIREITPAVGYNLSTTTVQVSPGYQNNITPVVLVASDVLQDVIKGTIRITKSDEDSGDLLSGAVFEVYTDYDRNNKIEEGQSPIQVITTGANGIAQTGQLPYGHYIVKEITAPYGYVLKPEEALHTNLFIETQGQTIDVSQENEEQRGGIIIDKLNVVEEFFPWSSEEMDFSGAEYNVIAVEMRLPNRTGAPKPGDIVATLITDENGNASTSVDALPLGTYDLVEVKSTSTTTVNSTGIRFRIEYDNQLKRFSELDYQDSTNHTGLINKYEDMQDQLYDYISTRNYTKVRPDRLNADSVGATTGLKDDGILDTYEAPRFGRIEIGKFFEEFEDTQDPTSGPLIPEAGILFRIYNHEGVQVDSILTNEEGFGTSNFLPYGRYQVVQDVNDDSIDPIDPFFVDVAENRDGDVHTYHFKNTVQPYRIKLIKKDAETGVTIPAAGVTFQLFETEDGGEPIALREWSMAHPDGYVDHDTFTTNSTGTVVLPNLLPYGTYYLQEVEAPEGYYLDPEGGRITLEVKGPHTIVELLIKEFEIDNIPQKGVLEVNKYGQIFKGLEDAELSKEIEDIISKSDMVALTEWVNVTEKVPVKVNQTEEKEVMEDVAVTDEIPVIVTGQLRDSEGNLLFNEDGTPLMGDVHATDDLGNLLYDIVPRLDEDGNQVYESRQKQDEEGNLLFETVIVLDEDGNPLEVDKLNEHGQPMYEDVIVLDADGNPVQKEVPVLDENGKPVLTTKDKDIELKLKEMIFERGYLKDAKFEIKANDEILSSDTITKFFDKGDLVATFTTTDTGDLMVLSGSYVYDEAQMKLTTLAEDTLMENIVLPLGKYTLQEIEAPEGYLLNSEIHEFEFTAQEQSVKFDIETLELENIKQNAEFKFNKEFEESQWFMRDEAYKDVVFGLYNSKAIVFNGIEIPADTLLGLSLVELNENNEYVGEFATMLAGEYYLKEITTSQEYKLADIEEGIEFTYDPAGDETIVIETGTIENELKKVIVKVIKVDSVNGNALEGAEFELWVVPNDGSAPYFTGKTYTTNSQGLIEIDNLEIGEYYLYELKAPEGYYNPNQDEDGNPLVPELPGNPIVVTPDKEDGDVIEHERENEQLVVKVDKVNVNEDVSLEGATLQLIDKETKEVVDQWVSNGEIHNISGKTVFGKEYIIKEIITPLGFITAKDIEFVQKNQHIMEYDVENEKIPFIGTTALFANGIKESKPGDNLVVIDRVEYRDLLVGKEYTMEAELVDKDNDKILATGSKTFTPEEPNGTIDVELTITVEVLTGTEMLVVERLYRDGRLLRLHPDFNDKDPENPNNLKPEDIISEEEYLKQVEEQTIRIPEIKTSMFDLVDMGKDALAEDDVKLIDIVKYEKLTPNETYTLVGTLMNKATNSPLVDAEGNVITAEKEFVASTSGNGEVELEFHFDGSLLKGVSAVAFESVYNDEIEVAVHADINDEEQTVYFPEIGTKAGNVVDGIADVRAEEKQVIVDTVKYSNLIVNEEYTVKGVLMDKSTGEPLLVNGEEIRSELTFVAESSEGTIDLHFELDASALAGETLVVFEDLYREDKLVAVHNDINDVEQTIYVPEIGTKAHSDQAEVSTSVKTVTIVDTVSYKNLIVGQEYEINGVLMDKSTEKPFLVNGEEVVSSVKFTPEEQDGTVEVIFEFDGLALPNVEVVVFESLLREGYEIAVHADINDEAQTVRFSGRKLDIKLVKHDSKDREILLNGALFQVKELDADGNYTGRVEYHRTGYLNINGDSGAKVLVSQNKDMSNAKEYTLETNGHLAVRADEGIWYYQFANDEMVHETIVGKGMAHLYQLAYGVGYEITELEAPASYMIGDNPTVVIYPEADYGVNVIENYRPNEKTPGGFSTSDSSAVSQNGTFGIAALISALGLVLISKKKRESN